MGTIGSRHAYQILQNSRRVLAVELICNLQAAEHRGTDLMASRTRQFYEAARKVIPSITKDRIFSKDIEKANQWLQQISLSTLIKPNKTKEETTNG
jgi:histidine ammonia-lyase